MFAKLLRVALKSLQQERQIAGIVSSGSDVFCLRTYSSKPVPQSDKNLQEGENARGKDETLERITVREMKDVSRWIEDDTPLERDAKRKASYFRTTYTKAMDEEDPEDEMAVLEYYVKKAQERLEETDDAEYYDVIKADKRLFFKMIDMWIKDSGGARRGHREFLQVCMNNVDRFNVQFEPKAYLKILECYPQSVHTGMRRNEWFKSVWQDKILDHELTVRLFGVMQKNGVAPSDEFYNTCMRLFGPYSRATLTMRVMLFWHPRLLSFSRFPIANKELDTLTPIDVAFYALRQAFPGMDATYDRFEVDATTKEDSNIEVSDATLDCIISIQNEKQKELLSLHDVSRPVFVEGPNTMYFKQKKVQYYVMRCDPVEKDSQIDAKTKILTDKEWWMKFYKKDFLTMKSLSESGEMYVKESFLPTVNIEQELSYLGQSPDEIAQVSNDTKAVEGDIYAIAATDYKSSNALRNWVTGLHATNPHLSQLTVVFNEKSSFLNEGFKFGPQVKEN